MRTLATLTIFAAAAVILAPRVPAGDHKKTPAGKPVRIEVPPDIQQVKKNDPGIAWQWRAVTRRAVDP